MAKKKATKKAAKKVAKIECHKEEIGKRDRDNRVHAGRKPVLGLIEGAHPLGVD